MTKQANNRAGIHERDLAPHTISDDCVCGPIIEEMPGGNRWIQHRPLEQEEEKSTKQEKEK